MNSITTIFFDIGGVLGTNGWDHVSRQRAAEHFNLDLDSFLTAHENWEEALDTGKIKLVDYINKTFFSQEHIDASDSQTDEILQFMKKQSQPNIETISIARQLAATKSFFMATLNNESIELNDYRIASFGLRPIFQSFFSSGYLGVRKPDPLIYERALHISQKDPATALFIDDREGNLVVPERLGMRTLHFVDANQLAIDLQQLGIDY